MLALDGKLSFDAGPRFEVVKPLGAGGMGVVYEAIDHDRKARVALKTLQSLEAEQLLLFKNEFRALQDIRHPNLIGLGELLESRGTWFFTMELLRGVEFLAYIRHEVPAPGASAQPASERSDATQTMHESSPSGGSAKGPASSQARFDQGRLRAALRQVAAGLHALHAGGKLHRDVKSSNMLVSDDGRAVLLDFGLVIELERAQAGGTGRVVGTAAYMSPEQASGSALGFASDWYSFGVVLFQALTGSVPFGGGGVSAMMDMKQNFEAPLASSVSPWPAATPPDLETLCAALLQRDPTRRPTGQQVLDVLAGGHVTPSPPTGQLFVGRSAELAQLVSADRERSAGRALTVLVHGESGQGKSALVREFLRQLSPEHVVLRGRCYERETTPFKGVDQVLEMLSAYLVTWGAEELATLLTPPLALASEVFPVLRRVAAIAALARPVTIEDPQELRARVFSAVRALFSRLASRAPVVIWIDDLQWADADSVALLAALQQGPSPPPILWLVTLRSGTGKDLERVSAQLGGDVRRLELGPLGLAEANMLVTRLVGVVREDALSLAPENVENIAREAAGHPLLIDALVRYRLAHADHHTPLRLDEAMWWRITRLPARERRVIEVLAVFAVPVQQAVAAGALASDLEEFDQMVGNLRSARLVQTTGPRPSDLIEVFHDRVRETVVGRLDAQALREWHGRLALTLEHTGHADAEKIAVHWRDAGHGARAVEYFVQAAEEARQALAFDRAVRLYREVLAIVSVTDPRRQPLRVRLAEALEDAGRGGEAGVQFVEAADNAQGDEALELRRRASEQFLVAGEVDRGLANLHAVLAEVGKPIPGSRASMLLSLAVVRARLALRGLAPAQRRELSPREERRMKACGSAALGLALVDNAAGAMYQTQALLLALRSGLPDHLTTTIAMESVFVSTAGQPAARRTEHLLAETRRFAELAGDGRSRAWIDGSLGAVRYLQSRFGEGLHHLDRAEEMFSRCHGSAWEVATARSMALWCLWYLGRLDEMHERLRSSCKDAENRGNLLAMANYRVGYTCNAWLALDDPDRADEEGRAGMVDWSQRAYHLQHSYDLYGRNQTRLYRGEAQAAFDDLEREWPRFRSSMLDRIETTRVFLVDLRARVALALAGVQPERAEALHRQVVRMARRLVADGAPSSVPMGQTLLGRVEVARGRTAEGRAQLARAVEGFAKNGMPIYRAAAAYRLAELAGNDAGRQECERLLAEIERHGIRAPLRMLALLAP